MLVEEVEFVVEVDVVVVSEWEELELGEVDSDGAPTGFVIDEEELEGDDVVGLDEMEKRNL